MNMNHSEVTEFDSLVESLQAIPTPALYEQLAEECTELGKAALKMARVLRKENPTPVTFNEASTMICEELSDCFTVCLVLGIDPDIKIIMEKMRRWVDRLREAGIREK